MADISTKPYLIRAIHEWCTDSGYRPYIAVVVDEHTVVPREFVRNGEIVLNVSSAATNRLRISNELIEFEARFGGAPRSVSIPMSNVSAIYAQETGHGMAFEVPKALALAPGAAAAREEGESAEGSDEDGGERLREVDPVSDEGAGGGESSRDGSARRSPSHSRRPRLAAVPSGKRSHTGSDGTGKGGGTVSSERADGKGAGSGIGSDTRDGAGSDTGSDTASGTASGTGTSSGKDARDEVAAGKGSSAERGNGKPTRRRRKDVSEARAPESGSGTEVNGQAGAPARQPRIEEPEAGGRAVLERSDANGSAEDTGPPKASPTGVKASAPGSEGAQPGEEKGKQRDDGQTPPDDVPPSPPVGRPRLRRVK